MAELTPEPPSQPETFNNNIFSLSNSTSNSSHGFAAAPKLSIKLEDKNFLLWNQQVEGIITSYKLHRFLVNPEIPQKFNSEQDRLEDNVSDAYERWLVQDQLLFTWLLSTLSDSVLPRVLSCKHSHQVWDRIHKHYYAHLKAKIRQLRSELKNTKKADRSITEYLSRIHTLADSRVAIGVNVTDQDNIDVILDGLPEEYNAFVMMIYGRPDSDSTSISEIEALLLVQEAQLDKHRQELSNTPVTTNVAHANHGGRSGNGGYRGRGRYNCGRGRGRGRFYSADTTTYNGETRPTCQLCGKTGLL